MFLEDRVKKNMPNSFWVKEIRMHSLPDTRSLNGGRLWFIKLYGIDIHTVYVSTLF